jgi:hypothetical protein
MRETKKEKRLPVPLIRPMSLQFQHPVPKKDMTLHLTSRETKRDDTCKSFGSHVNAHVAIVIYPIAAEMFWHLCAVRILVFRSSNPFILVV